jgi:hypothetical protein
MVAAAPTFEIGTVTDVTIAAGVVVKTTRSGFSEQQAEAIAGQIEQYHAAIAAGPLAVAEMVGVNVVRNDDGYHVKQVMELIEGDSLLRLPYEERLVAVGGLAQTIENMPEGPAGPRSLLTPLDAKGRNFHMRGGVPVLIDVCPSYTWGEDNYVHSAIVPDMWLGLRAQTTAAVGYRAAVLAELLPAAAPPRLEGESELNHAIRITATVPKWSASFIPKDIPPNSRDDLELRLDNKLRVTTYRALRDARKVESDRKPDANPGS